jgi:hypothetical protein
MAPLVSAARAFALPGLFALSVAGQAGCAVIDVQRGAPLNMHARWALLPIVDYSEATQAGARVEDTVSALMRMRLQVELTKYPLDKDGKGGDVAVELDERQRYERALEWAKKEGFTYGITGTVNEWRYRNGADGEAAVGFTLNVVDPASGRTLWSATGARSGWGRETVSGTAQRLLRAMLVRIEQQPAGQQPGGQQPAGPKQLP